MQHLRRIVKCKIWRLTFCLKRIIMSISTCLKIFMRTFSLLDLFVLEVYHDSIYRRLTRSAVIIEYLDRPWVTPDFCRIPLKFFRVCWVGVSGPCTTATVRYTWAELLAFNRDDVTPPGPCEQDGVDVCSSIRDALVYVFSCIVVTKMIPPPLVNKPGAVHCPPSQPASFLMNETRACSRPSHSAWPQRSKILTMTHESTTAPMCENNCCAIARNILL